MKKVVLNFVSFVTAYLFFNFLLVRCADGIVLKPKIHFVCTAAIIPHLYEQRKRQYINSLILLKKYGCNLYVIESCQRGPTFLDEYCERVCYTQTNNPAYVNKGINEAISLSAGLKFYNFDPEDMIIKFTGRYSLEKDEFIKLVETNYDADVIARIWNENDAYTALFAIKVKYLLDFLNNYIDYKAWLMNEKNICIEHLFGAYITRIRNKGAKVVPLERVCDYLPIATPHRCHLKGMQE